MNEAQRRVLSRAGFAAGVFAGLLALDPLTNYGSSDDGRGWALLAISFAGFVVGSYIRAGKSN